MKNLFIKNPLKLKIMAVKHEIILSHENKALNPPFRCLTFVFYQKYFLS